MVNSCVILKFDFSIQFFFLFQNDVDEYFSEVSYLYDSFILYQKALDAIIAKHEEDAMNNFLKENKIDVFLKLNNVTLKEYQDFLVLNETRSKNMISQLIAKTTTTTTTDNTLFTTNTNQTGNVNTTAMATNTTSNTSATLTATITHVNVSHNNITDTTLPTTYSNVSIGITYNTKNATTTTAPTSTEDPFSKWAEKNWTFPGNWTKFDNSVAAENQSSPSWYVRNRTFPIIDEALILDTIDYEAILNNKTKVIEHMRKVNLFGKYS